MPVTRPLVQIGLFEMSIKQSATFGSAEVQTFSKHDDLKTNRATTLPFASYEKNFWLLDGNHKFIPEDLNKAHVGVVSSALSSATGLIPAPNPGISIVLPYEVQVDDLSFVFGQATNDYPTNMRIDYRRVEILLSDQRGLHGH